MKCQICSEKSRKIFKTEVLRKYSVQYYQCSFCGFIQTEKPYWLEEAYASSMNICDTGILQRNLYFSKICTVIFSVLFNSKKPFLDYGGGYGVFTRLMRDIGFNFYWIDPYTKNLLSRGFEYDKSLGKVEAVTAFELFEHFLEIKSEVKRMLKFSDTILFSTELLPNNDRIDTNWWYFAFEHGQHIALYTEKSLHLLAQELNLHFYTNGSTLHIFSKKKIHHFLFNLLLLLTPLLYPILKRRKRSLTFSDHLLLK